jgi:hypothetical protein
MVVMSIWAASFVCCRERRLKSLAGFRDSHAGFTAFLILGTARVEGCVGAQKERGTAMW